MIIRRMILLWYLLVHIAITNAQESEIAVTDAGDAVVKPSLYCDLASVAEISKSVKSTAVEQVAESLGITDEDLTSVPSGIGNCCSSSLSCYFRGGICLPSWLNIFFSCSEANLCYSSSCTCFKPRDSCTSCGGSCGSGGTCRSSCIYPEVAAPYNCGIVPGCTCCMLCPSSCSGGGTCRAICNRDDTDIGPCNDLQACRCCKKNVCSGSCSNTGQCRESCDLWGERDVGSCGSSCRCCEPISSECWGQSCGMNGYCSDYCEDYQLARAKRVAPAVDIGYLPCPKGCRCCPYDGPYPIDPVEPVEA